MLTQVASLPTLDGLRRHVLQTLCRHDHLDAGQTPLLQSVMMQAGKRCGLFFQAQGPRLLKTYALWVCAEHRILFYDSTGLRFAETQLSAEPEPIRDAEAVSRRSA